MTTITINQQSYDVDAILFDKDGTLLNFGDLWLGWLSALLRQVNGRLEPNRHIPPHDIAGALGVSPDFQQWDPTGPLTIGSMDDIVSILSLHLYQHADQAWNDASRLVRDSMANLESETDPALRVTAVAGLTEFLVRAREQGVVMAVVTSDDTSSAHQHLRRLEIDGYFPVVLGHDQVARGKPYPDMALTACDKLGVAPHRTLLFGDSNGDMKMAREAGLVAGIGLTPAPHLGTRHLADADQIIRHYGEVSFPT
ncbi:HAD family hydrolase [Saccharospirillum salsuginis]|uniref:Phosphatase n=1 Tax=Saccharospirillum salsuginis TaxID=418750 RepID=A0A918K033_9GAMM|nr:HAD family phosphatase [Saccharospirillum salsuginis]GGX40982.1 phosphatase [Saccharospirillum salsuginis]